MHAVKEIGHTQALEALLGELDERLGPVTHQGQRAGAQGLQPLVHQRFPRGVGAMWQSHFIRWIGLLLFSKY